LEETYNCVIENSHNCDADTDDKLVKEIKAMHSILGNTSCPRIPWCQTSNSSAWSPWQQEICVGSGHCM